MLKTFLSPHIIIWELSKYGELCQKMSKNNTIYWGDYIEKQKIIILLLCAVLIIGLVIYAVDKHSSKKRTDVAIPVLLYHNFVTIVPDSDPDNYSYINTPESFEENIKTLLDNGYTTISFKRLKWCLFWKKHTS